MKELLAQLAAYNLWADQRILDTINSLDEEKQHRTLASSFKSLYDTTFHIWNSSSVWWQRMKLQERIIAPSESFKGNMQELSQHLLQQDQLWLDWVNNATDAAIEHVFQYYNSKKEYFKQPVFQVMAHVFNHNTYHRGQLVTMLRQLGVEKIPDTDLIIFTRKK